MAADFSLVEAFAKMALVRSFETHLLDSFSRGELMGTTHTCLGQEANAVGVALALEPGDVVVSNHRCHGHFLAHIGDVDGLLAEIMGKKTGVCGGAGGSQHLAVPGAFYANGVQGGIAPLATGIALAEKWKKSGHVTVVFLGDGTFGEGVVYESLNIAALHQAPILFVVENNHIAQTTPTERTTAGTFEDRAHAFGIPNQRLSYPLVDEVFETARRAVDHVRNGSGPFFLIIDSVRLGPHSKGDDTRSKDEMKLNLERDPFAGTEALLPADEASAIKVQARQKVGAAYEFAESSPDATSDIGSEKTRNLPEALPAEQILDAIDGRSFRDQINSGLHRLMAENGQAVIMGEDVLDPYGGAFKVTDGLSSAFPERVISMPISEAAMVGVAGGLAMHGYNPVVEIMFGDFLSLAMDQLINHIARYRDMYNGQIELPVVVRTPMGGRRGYGPSHSQTLDKHFLGISGLRVLAPSHLHPAAEMVRAAASNPDPTLFIENKVLYSQKLNRRRADMVDEFFVRYQGELPTPWLLLSLTEFNDEVAVIICYGGMVPVAMDAARTLLLEEEVSARIVAPSCIYPLDGAILANQLSNISLIVAVEEGSAPFGFGAEIGALLAEIGILNGRRFGRVAAREQAIGAAQSMENAILPQSADIADAVLRLI